MSVLDLTPNVRGKIGVSASYDDEAIPDLIRRCINRLLRDYHFPKAVRRLDFAALALNTNTFALPVGFKKELEFRLYDPTSASWTDPLIKRENFQLPYPNRPNFYWLQGTDLVIDTKIDASRVGFSGVLWYESMDAASNEDWMTTDFPDAVMYASIVRGCAEYRKPEIMQTFMPLWEDERQSLAIYLNELEWNNADIMMKEPRRIPLDRYPIS